MFLSVWCFSVKNLEVVKAEHFRPYAAKRASDCFFLFMERSHNLDLNQMKIDQATRKYTIDPIYSAIVRPSWWVYVDPLCLVLPWALAHEQFIFKASSTGIYTYRYFWQVTKQQSSKFK